MIERKMLSLETTQLLDKLYNLRGNESVILVEMDKNKDKATDTKKRTTTEKAELQDKIANLEDELAKLQAEGEKLLIVLNGIDRNDYSTVLDRLSIDFDPEKLKKQVNDSLPKTISGVEDNINDAKAKLMNVEDEMSQAETTISELSIRRDAAISNQNRLNEFFELALAGNINITRDQITALLLELNLTEEEAREGAKLLMFPEDALFEYDRRYNDSSNASKTISEVFKEANESALEEETIAPEEEVKEEVISEEEVPVDDFTIVDVEEETTMEDNEVVPVVMEEEFAEEFENELLEKINEEQEEIVASETVVEETTGPKDNKDALIELLQNEGIDYLDINNSDMEELVANYNEELIRNNIKTIKDQSIDTDMLIDNVSLFYDAELKDKLNLLISVGKEPLDIYFNSKVLIKYDYQGLQNAIELLKENGLDPKKVPLMAY